MTVLTARVKGGPDEQFEKNLAHEGERNRAGKRPRRVTKKRKGMCPIWGSSICIVRARGLQAQWGRRIGNSKRKDQGGGT